MRHTLRVLFAVPLLALAACREAVERVFTPPRVTFAGVALRTMGLAGGSVDVFLRIHNPNPYALTATRASYRLLVADSVEVGHGTSLDTVRVGARDSATVRLPLDVSWRGLQAAGRSAVRGGAVDYRILGEIVAQTPIGAHTFPLDSRGRAAAPAPR
ncbi:MAG TPA: LEA type 2 family protein [Gemmatimonadaceae bacterium]|nr:LEA type 2 family protein [Gemmatimonadaceae bacterium]